MMQPAITSVIDTTTPTPAARQSPQSTPIHDNDNDDDDDDNTIRKSRSRSSTPRLVDSPVPHVQQDNDATTNDARSQLVHHEEAPNQLNGRGLEQTNGHSSDGEDQDSALSSASSSRLSTPPPQLLSDAAPDHVTDAMTAVNNTNNDKKRKLAELEPQSRSRSASRPPSPPWKKFGAEGPTAFLEDGKRRSGRVNAVPMPLLPSSGKRQTRPRQRQPLVQTQAQSLAKSQPHPPPARSHKKRESSANAQQTPATSRTPASKTTTNLPKAAPKNNTPKVEKTSPKTGKKEESCGVEVAVVDDAPITSSPVRKTSSRLRKLGQRHNQDGAKPDGTPGQLEKADTKVKQMDKVAPATPRITLRLRRTDPVFLPRHPSHIPSIPAFPTIEEALAAIDAKEKEQEKAAKIDENYEGLERARTAADRERPSELNLSQLAEREARTRLRILEAAEPGGPLSREKSSLFLPDEQAQPSIQYSHNDHLWAHGHYFKVLLDREKRTHVEQAKKFAYACLARWKERQPQTEEEMERDERIFFETIYRQLVKDVGRKWELVGEEINRRRHAKWEFEEKKRREKRMQEVMERSTNLLDARKAAREAREESLLSADDSMDGAEYDDGDTPAQGSLVEDGDDDDDDSDEREDSDVMSDSDSESDDEAIADDPDANLSPEALRRKYASLPDLPASPEPPDADDDQDDNDDEDDHDGSDVESHDDQTGPGAEEDTTHSTALQDDDIETPTIDTDDAGQPSDVPERDYAQIQLEEVDEALLDDSDESIDMSDEDVTSDEDEDEEEDGSDEDEDEEAAGLLALLGDRKTVVEQEADQSADGGAEDTATPAEQIDDVVPGKSAQIACGNTLEERDKAQSDDAEHPVSRDDTHGEPMNTAIDYHEDRSSQLSPKDDTTADPTEAESTTSIDLEDSNKIVESNEHTPQPTTHRPRTKIPSLLRGTLREYQHEGLDWLAKLYANKTNGILADEMGLGKTIQTIALLAHLAEEHEIWGPHLIVVPTSVILNWEMEFKKFLPGFKVLSYYGSVEERAQKRKGWSNPDNYNVVITSYQLILKDIMSIKVPAWHYMILDEAHNIKNFNSQRYRAMIRLKTHARLLLTGTPLQNNIQELWSLLTFLTAGHDGQGMGELHEFEEWFSKPVNEIFMDSKQQLSPEAQKIVNKLHHSLRPYLLRRLKAHVEKQLPGKYEHTVICRLSKRQRQLYDAFMGLSDTKAKLSSCNMVSVSMALMALRKVCNHPDLFEERPIVTSFAMPKPYSKMPRAAIADYEIKNMLVRRKLLHEDPSDKLDLDFLSLNLASREVNSGYHVRRSRQLRASGVLNQIAHRESQALSKDTNFNGSSFASMLAHQNRYATAERLDKIRKYAFLTKHRTDFVPVYGTDLVERVTIRSASDRLSLNPPRERAMQSSWYLDTSSLLRSAVKTVPERAEEMNPLVQKFACITPNVVAENLLSYTTPTSTLTAVRAAAQADMQSLDPLAVGTNEEILRDPYHEARVRLSIAFPDKRLLQYDCGKLQRLAPLLRSLTSKGSRALIFTQMTSVLDILESFLNIHGYRYLRLDGSTRIEQRQDMMERFNRDTRIDVFILSSRSGGVGMNLTGADTVIFYDLDWNPQMDRQCQDRAHRIGQMRDVHIYKFVSESTIEVNILQKSAQKRLLDEVVIQEGEFTTDWFKQDQKSVDGMDPGEAKGDDVAASAVEKFFGSGAVGDKGGAGDIGQVLEKVEDAEDVLAARGQAMELKEAGVDFEEDFSKEQLRPSSSTSASASLSTSHAGTPLPGHAGTVGDVDVSTTVGAAEVGTEAATAGPEVLVNADDDEIVTKGDGTTEPVTSVDEYMLRFVESVLLRGVLYSPPVDRKRARLDRNGRDRSHRAKRIR